MSDDYKRLYAVYNATTAMEWERAKGSLRAVVAGLGSLVSTVMDENGELRFEKTQRRFEEFIKEVEDEELHLMP